MDYDKKILELQRRIEILEKAENKRIAKKKRQIIFEICKIAVFLIILVLGYCFVYIKFIKPYKEKVNFINNKIESVEDFVNDKLNVIDKYNPFS